MTPEQRAEIDAMTHIDLCRHWRFAPVGDPLFQDGCGEYFRERLRMFGGFTPAISKAIGRGR